MSWTPLLTHEHADHMKGVHQFTRKHAVRVYATRHTAMCVQEKAPEAPWAYFEKGQSFRIGGYRHYSLPHLP